MVMGQLDIRMQKNEMGLLPCTIYKNKHFFKEDTQVANKQRERCSTSLIIREMQIKTQLGFGLGSLVEIPTRMAVIKKSDDNKSFQECEEIRTLYIACGNVK